MNPIIIIGAGLAAYTLARELRKLDKTTPLTIVAADDGGFYSKPMLSNAFAQNRHAAQLVTQSAEQMAVQLDATIMASSTVSAIDTVRKTVTTQAGEMAYDKLVLAVGAEAIRLPVQGDGAARILSVNHVADYGILRERIQTLEDGRPARVTILGAGLIGCEFADDLRGGGHEVTLVDPNPAPLALLAPPVLSDGLQAALLMRGILLRLGTTAVSVTRQDDGLLVTLADGNLIESDVVLSAVGLRPHLSLAKAAGLETGRGILVDVLGRTSAPDVYALGDCAEYAMAVGDSRTMPYVAPLMAAARAIARSVGGEPTEIEHKPAPVLVKTPCFPMALMPVAPGGGQWRTEIDEKGRTVCRHVDDNGIVTGFGVSPHDMAIRNKLVAELGQPYAGENAP
jgi:rubredoxin-NAD+ reductase